MTIITESIDQQRWCDVSVRNRRHSREEVEQQLARYSPGGKNAAWLLYHLWDEVGVLLERLKTPSKSLNVCTRLLAEYSFLVLIVLFQVTEGAQEY
jgi:hypothetical protein